MSLNCHLGLTIIAGDLNGESIELEAPLPPDLQAVLAEKSFL